MLAVLGLLVLTAVVFKEQLFGHWTFPWDFVGAYTATPAFVAASVGGGHLLSWSPYVASGFPVDLDPQAGIYFPGWWLLGGLGIPATLRVLTAVQVLHVLLGSVGVMLLAHARQLSWRWATLAAVAFLFFGGFYGEAEHADIFRGFAYVPWLFWALTPLTDQRRWGRLVALAPLTWLIATGAYPGQIPSFAVMGFVYLGVALLADGGSAWRRHRRPLLLAVVGSAGVCVAVLLPYLLAEHAHELYRAEEPTAAVRGAVAFAPRDLLGLYLNSFAWNSEGTLTAWSVGVPVLVGLAALRSSTLRRQAPLVACGLIALALATAPRIGFVGSLMADLRPLFPSRFPPAEYKAFVAVALVIVAADAWSEMVSQRRGLRWRAVLIGIALVAGALLAPSTFGSPTRELWLVLIVILASVTLVLVRLPGRLLVCLLVTLVVLDGAREINDYLLLGRVSPWRVSPAEAAPYRARDLYIRKLPSLLAQAPASRPARIPPYETHDGVIIPNGHDASGWIADGYHMIDLDGSLERVLWNAEHNPALSALLLAPWHSYTFPCDSVGCASDSIHLPAPRTWTPSSEVRTLSYSTNDIVYSVNTSRAVLMVENELAIRGWHADSRKVSAVSAGLPLRAWRLAAGRYTFTASFREPDRLPQEIAVAVAVIAWLSCALMIYRRRPELPTRRMA
jgi:hypothetical protein